MDEARQAREALGSEAELLDPGSGKAAFPGFTPGASKKLRSMRKQGLHLKERDLALAFGARLLVHGFEGYPEALEAIPLAPPALFLRGRLPPDGTPALAMIGSRRCTPEGKRRARHMGRDMARQGLAVVSGLARGIDAAAMRGCLLGEGPTVGVLGCGLDIVYPPENARLYLDTLESGGLLSEFPLGTPPLRHHFPRRNRIISGLSRGILIVEASEKSGSLITADHGLEQDRIVMAMPGLVGPAFYRGSNRLIRDGAQVVLDSEDVLAAFNLPYEKVKQRSGPEDARKQETGPDAIAALCAHEALTVEELVERSGRDQGEVLRAVSTLELKGILKREPGGRFLTENPDR